MLQFDYQLNFGFVPHPFLHAQFITALPSRSRSSARWTNSELQAARNASANSVINARPCAFSSILFFIVPFFSSHPLPLPVRIFVWSWSRFSIRAPHAKSQWLERFHNRLLMTFGQKTKDYKNSFIAFKHFLLDTGANYRQSEIDYAFIRRQKVNWKTTAIPLRVS